MKHQKIEKNVGLMIILIIVALSFGTLVELVPLLFAKETNVRNDMVCGAKEDRQEYLVPAEHCVDVDKGAEQSRARRTSCVACQVSATVDLLPSTRCVSHTRRLLTSVCASEAVSVGNNKGE